MHTKLSTLRGFSGATLIAVALAVFVIFGVVSTVATDRGEQESNGDGVQIEHVSPASHRPTDRPWRLIDVTIEPTQPAFHRPTDRP